MERDILHLSIPSFPIALARAADPSLRGRPVAVAPSTSERAIVSCVSGEARREGVFEGMPVFRARRFCPALRLLPPDPRLVGEGMKALLALSYSYTPLWEPAAPGHLFLDLTGSRRLLGPGRDAAARLDREVKERLNLRGAVGVAGNKMVSRIAAGCLERPGVCDVLRGSEGPFLAPMAVSVLPGVGRAREQLLMTDLNIRSVGEVAALSAPHLALAFGPFAPLLYQRSRGVDPSPVLPPRRSTDIEEEAYLTREDNDDKVLTSELCRLAEGCGRSLRALRRRAGTLTLTVRYADGLVERRAAAFPHPQDGDLALLSAASDLFLRMSRRVRVSGLQMVCGRLVDRSEQGELFAAHGAADRKSEALQKALDRVRERYGAEAVRWGRSQIRGQSPEETGDGHG